MANLENKLSKAYGKVGKKIGSLFDIYNAESHEDTPIDSLHWVSEKHAVFTQSDFKSSKEPGFKIYECYVGFGEVMPGSVLVSKDTDQIFQILNHEVNHGINAIECFNTISISRNASAYDGSSQSSESFVKYLPCAIMISGTDTTSGIVALAGTSSTFTHSATIKFQTIVKLDIQIGDSIVDDNYNEYQVMAVEYSSTGYKLVVHGI